MGCILKFLKWGGVFYIEIYTLGLRTDFSERHDKIFQKGSVKAKEEITHANMMCIYYKVAKRSFSSLKGGA